MEMTSKIWTLDGYVNISALLARNQCYLEPQLLKISDMAGMKQHEKI